MAVFLRTALAALVALAFAFLSASADATHVACGATLTQDTTLDSDLTCNDDGLVVGANGVTLDLGGHTLRGIRSEAAPTGIRTAADNVTVRNGTVERFGTGIDVGGGVNVLLTGLTLRDHDDALGIRNVQNARLTQSTIGSTGPGFETVLASGDGIQVTGNRFTRTFVLFSWDGRPVEANLADNVFAGGGVRSYRFSNVDVLRNRLTGAEILFADNSGGRVRRNVVADAPQVGIELAGFSHPVVERNVVTGAGSDGIREMDGGGLFAGDPPDPTPATIAANEVRASGGDGIEVIGGACTRLEGNVVRRSDRHGIHLQPAGEPRTSCASAVPVIANRAVANGVDGIHVVDTVAPVLLRGNRTERNGDDGIDVDGLAATYADPVWSPAGDAVAYAADPVNGPGGIWLAAPDNSDAVFLTQGEQPAWAPDGSRIAFVRRDAPAGIYTVAPDGSSLQQITDGGTRPQWSPDGDTILFERDGALWTVPASGGTPVFLAAGRDAEWSPDGERIVYVDGTDLYVIAADGSGQTWIWEGAMPTWSPDGEQIAFTDSNHLYVARPDGSGLQQITDSPCSGSQDPCRRDFAPDWSHDGERILFTDGAVLLSVRPDGSGLERLTEPAEPSFPGAPIALVSDPRWSPADDAIVFERGDHVEVLAGESLVGLSVDTNPFVTIAGNRADANADLGIEAVEDVTDGGGNRARHNGDRRQCVNVACR